MNHRVALPHIHSQIAQRSAAALVLLFLAIAAAATTASAGTLNGTVKNGTTGQLAAGADVILIQLQGGMQPIANTKSDAQGHFHFDNPQLGAGPMLVDGPVTAPYCRHACKLRPAPVQTRPSPRPE